MGHLCARLSPSCENSVPMATSLLAGPACCPLCLGAPCSMSARRLTLDLCKYDQGGEFVSKPMIPHLLTPYRSGPDCQAPCSVKLCCCRPLLRQSMGQPRGRVSGTEGRSAGEEALLGVLKSRGTPATGPRGSRRASCQGPCSFLAASRPLSCWAVHSFHRSSLSSWVTRAILVIPEVAVSEGE